MFNLFCRNMQRKGPDPERRVLGSGPYTVTPAELWWQSGAASVETRRAVTVRSAGFLQAVLDARLVRDAFGPDRHSEDEVKWHGWRFLSPGS